MTEPIFSPLARLMLGIATRLLPPVRQLRLAYDALQAEYAQAQQLRLTMEQRARVYEALFDQTLDAVAIFSLDSACFQVNQPMSNLLGYPVSEMLGIPYHGVAVDQQKSSKIFERVIHGEIVPTYECQVRRKDGSIIDIEASPTLVRDADGQPLHVQALLRDIGERRKIATAMADQNQLLNTIINNMPDYVYVKDRQGRYILDNLAHARSVGHTQQEIIGKTVDDLFSPELAARYRADHEKIILDGQSLISYEEPSRSVDGNPIWALSSKVPLRDSSGQVVGVVGVTRDITERKEREKQLEDNQRFVEKLTAAIPDVIYVFDFEAGVYRYYNDEAIKRLLGYPEEVFRREDQSFMASIMHPDDQDNFVHWYERFKALKDNEVLETHYRLMHHDGRYRNYYSRDQVFARNADGIPSQSFGIAQDITEEVEADQQLRRQNEYLRALSEVTPGLINRIDPTDILKTVILRVQTLMQTEDVHIDILDEERGVMRDYISMGNFADYEMPVKKGEGIVGIVWETGETLVINDYRFWPHRLNIPELDTLRASIGVPLKSANRVFGVMGLGYTDPDRHFAAEEIDILNRIAELAAIALDNANLHLEAQNELEERVRVEAALRASEERYRALIETQTELVGRCLPDMTLTFVNNAYCRFFNLSADELVGQSFEWLVADEDRSQVHAQFAALTRTQPAQTILLRFRRPDGSLHWLECANRAIFGLDEQVVEYQTVARDVTEKRQAEEALRLSEARFRAVVESQTELICRFSWDNKLTFVNEAYCRYFDQTPEEILGRQIPLRIPEDEWAVMEPLIQAQLRGEVEVQHYEHRVFAPNGELRWQQWTDRVIRDEDGKVIELQAVGRDITEQKQAQLDLNAERDFVAAILANTVSLIVVMDTTGTIVTYNRACEAVTGYPGEEIIGTKLWDKLLLPEEAGQVEGVIRQMVAGDYPNKNVNYWVTRENHLRLIEWSNTVITDKQGAVTHIVSSGVDITARRQLEERSLELALEREKVKILGNFIRDASHDFRTPLSILNTNLYLLRRSLGTDTLEPRLSEMEQQVIHLTQLIDQLLTMTRLDSEADVKMNSLSLNDLVQNVSASVINTVRTKNLHYTVKLADNLPALWADAWQLNQALRNIVSNAVQYTPPGGTVEVTTRRENGELLVEVRDTGVGIDESDLPHIFERFYRADKARSSEAGTGLGLAIARKIIDIHRGRISVETRPGEGTTFTIALPIHEPALNSMSNE